MRRYFFRLFLLLSDTLSFFTAFYIVYFAFNYFYPEFKYSNNLLFVDLVIFIIMMMIEETYSLREEDLIKKSYYILKGVFFTYVISFLFLYNISQYSLKQKYILIGNTTLWFFLLFFVIIAFRYIVESISIKYNLYIHKTLVILADNEDKKDFRDIFKSGLGKVNRVRSVFNYKDVLDMSDDDIQKEIVEKNISQVMIFSKNIDFKSLMEIEGRFEGKVFFIKIIPDFTYLNIADMEVIYINERLVLENRQKLLSPYRAIIKRVVDIILAIIFITLFSPIMLITAICIVLESPGSPIFTQKRLGRGKKNFKVFKFRSMYKDAEPRLKKMLAEDEKVREEYKKWAKLKNDPRITRVGNWIRKLSIDEMPQFFNVLFGTMSVMGPRPYLISELEQMGYKANIILAAKPGITGLWQIRGRNALTFDERVQLESYYIKNWSLWLDFVILFMTPYAVIFKRKTG